MGLYKEETNLKTNDIFRANPQAVKFTTKREASNPLNPHYSLSKVEYRPVTPPKFIRDQMQVDDIDKAKPKVDTRTAAQTKNIMKIDDIEGAVAHMRHKAR